MAATKDWIFNYLCVLYICIKLFGILYRRTSSRRLVMSVFLPSSKDPCEESGLGPTFTLLHLDFHPQFPSMP